MDVDLAKKRAQLRRLKDEKLQPYLTSQLTVSSCTVHAHTYRDRQIDSVERQRECESLRDKSLYSAVCWNCTRRTRLRLHPDTHLRAMKVGTTDHQHTVNTDHLRVLHSSMYATLTLQTIHCSLKVNAHCEKALRLTTVAAG